MLISRLMQILILARIHAFYGVSRFSFSRFIVLVMHIGVIYVYIHSFTMNLEKSKQFIFWNWGSKVPAFGEFWPFEYFNHNTYHFVQNSTKELKTRLL